MDDGRGITLFAVGVVLGFLLGAWIVSLAGHPHPRDTCTHCQQIASAEAEVEKIRKGVE